MKRFTAFLILVCLLFLSSCTSNSTSINMTDTADSTEKNTTPQASEIQTSNIPSSDDEIPANEKMFSKSLRHVIYKNMYFYSNSFKDRFRTIRYQYTDNVVEGGHSIYSNTQEPYDGFFSSYSISQIAIDYNATEKNNGIPVLIVLCRKKDAQNYSLVSFNMATEKITVILQDTGSEDSTAFYVYGNTIYYYLKKKVSPIKHVVKMYSVKTNGTDVTEYSTEFDNIVPQISIYNDKIYYTLNTNLDPYIYVTDLNFENTKGLMKIDHTVPNPSISNGYVYYADDERTVLIDQAPISVHNIYRRSLDDFDNSSPELLVQNAHTYYLTDSKLIYYIKDDLIKIDGNNGGFYAPCVLRMYDLNTQDSKTLISSPKNEDSIISVKLESSEYLMLEKGRIVKGEEREYFFININTGKIYPLSNDT